MLPPLWGTRTLPLLPALQPPAPAMTDPSACKTTIALISGGGKGCLRAPWAPGPFFQLGFPSPGSGVPWGRGWGSLGGPRSPVSHDEVGGFFTSGGPRCEGCPAEPPTSHCGHLTASASLPSKSPHCLGPYLSSSPRAGAGRLETQGMAPTWLSLSLGGWPIWEGWTGCWVVRCLWELCCWSLDSCNPRDPTTTPEKPGAVESPDSLPPCPYFCLG